MDYKDKQVRLVVKELNIAGTDNGVIRISGYANKYLDEQGNLVVDRSRESVLPQGYDLQSFLKNPVLLYMHQHDRPIGKVINVDIRTDGLYIEAEVHKVLDEKAYYGVENGILKTFSIGFIIKDYAEVDGVMLWTSVELAEVSIVSVPDNQDSLFSILTESPCQSGTCLLGNKAISKSFLLKHNKELMMTEWKSIDKTKLKDTVSKMGGEAIEEVYLIAKDLDNPNSWKFPHHSVVDGVLITNYGGIKSAFSALKSVDTDDILSVEDRIMAAEHLLRHTESLIEEGVDAESTKEAIVTYLDSLKSTGETMETKENGADNATVETEPTDTDTTTDVDSTENSGGDEQPQEENTINTTDTTGNDGDSGTNPQNPTNPTGEGDEPTSDGSGVGVDTLKEVVDAMGDSDEEISALLELYSTIEDKLNATISLTNTGD